jgi:serine/threonine protein kinase
MHNLGVLHRDIKPENVMITFAAAASDVSTRLIDLGNATAPSLLSKDAGFSACCTADYLAPECWDFVCQSSGGAKDCQYCSVTRHSRQPYSESSELWSFGKTILDTLRNAFDVPVSPGYYTTEFTNARGKFETCQSFHDWRVRTWGDPSAVIAKIVSGVVQQCGKCCDGHLDLTTNLTKLLSDCLRADWRERTLPVLCQDRRPLSLPSYMRTESPALCVKDRFLESKSECKQTKSLEQTYYAVIKDICRRLIPTMSMNEAFRVYQNSCRMVHAVMTLAASRSSFNNNKSFILAPSADTRSNDLFARCTNNCVVACCWLSAQLIYGTECKYIARDIAFSTFACGCNEVDMEFSRENARAFCAWLNICCVEVVNLLSGHLLYVS